MKCVNDFRLRLGGRELVPIVIGGMGVDIFRVKITAFVITSALAGLAGAFYANYVGVLAPTMLTMSEMGMVVAMAVIGGLGHRYGALVGVLVIRTLEHFVRGFGAEYTLVIITGVALLSFGFLLTATYVVVANTRTAGSTCM